MRRYAAKPQKRSDAKIHGFIFIDGAFCVWQNIIRLYYAVTRQNSGAQLSVARKPDECALVKREACVETWLRWIGLRHRLATTLLRNTAVSLRDLRQPSEFSRAGGDELPNITHRTPTFGAMPMPWCRRDRDATTLRRVRRRFFCFRRAVEDDRLVGFRRKRGSARFTGSFPSFCCNFRIFPAPSATKRRRAPPSAAFSATYAAVRRENIAIRHS